MVWQSKTNYNAPYIARGIFKTLLEKNSNFEKNSNLKKIEYGNNNRVWKIKIECF